MHIAFLHTLSANQTLFETHLSQRDWPNVSLSHHVATPLLEHASQHGFDATLDAMVAEQITQLEQLGATLIICTCSSIGRLAEQTETQHAKVLRVDRPMAIAAANADQLLVLAALETTLTPTTALLAEYRDHDEDGDLANTQVAVIPFAWQHYLNGDLAQYAQRIADAICEAANTSLVSVNNQRTESAPDCILLAQASMSEAVNLLPHSIRHRVLTSPDACLNHIEQHYLSDTNHAVQ